MRLGGSGHSNDHSATKKVGIQVRRMNSISVLESLPPVPKILAPRPLPRNFSFPSIGNSSELTKNKKDVRCIKKNIEQVGVTLGRARRVPVISEAGKEEKEEEDTDIDEEPTRERLEESGDGDRVMLNKVDLGMRLTPLDQLNGRPIVNPFKNNQEYSTESDNDEDNDDRRRGRDWREGIEDDNGEQRARMNQRENRREQGGEVDQRQIIAETIGQIRTPGNQERVQQPLVAGNQSVSTDVEGVDPHSNLIDVEWNKLMGVMTGISNGLDYFPDNLIIKIRNLYIDIFGKIEISKRDNNIPELNFYIKLMTLLPIILCVERIGNTDMNNKNNRAKKVANNIKLIEESIHSKSLEIKISEIKKKNNLQTYTEKPKAVVYDKVDIMVAEGDIHKASKILYQSSTTVPRGEATHNIIDAQYHLRNPQLTQDITPEMMSVLHKKSEPKEIKIEKTKLMEIISAMNPTVTAGPDQLSNKMLKQLVGKSKVTKTAVEREFIDQLSSFVGNLSGGMFPESYYQFLRDVEVIGIPKGDAPVTEVLRTISKPSTWRKLMVAPMLQETRADIKQLFGNLQYAFASDGTTKIINSTRYAIQSNPHLNVAQFDGVTAFNSIERIRALMQMIGIDLDKWLPLMYNLYGSASSNFYFGSPECIKASVGEIGAQQGCTAGTLVFCMAIYQLTLGLNNLLPNNSDGFLKLFVDDIIATTKFPELVDQLNFIMIEGPKYGYNLNLAKCKFMLGVCENQEQCRERIDTLLSFGFQIENIKIHPDNGGDLNNYGMKMLGSFIGSDEFIINGLEKKVEELTIEGNKLIDYMQHNPQAGTLLLTRSFSKKSYHLYRTINPDIMIKHFNVEWEKLLKNIFFAACGNPGGSETNQQLAWDQFRLKPENGGHGIGFVDDIAITAYIANQIEFIEASDGGRSLSGVTGNLANRLMDLQDDNSALVVLRKAMKIIENIDPSKTINIISQMKSTKARSFQGQLTDLMNEKRYEDFLSKLEAKNEVARLAWVLSQKDSDGNSWIQQIPKIGDTNTIMLKREMNVAMCLKYFLNQSCIPAGRQCVCHHEPDPIGLHLAGGCSFGGDRQNTHDSMKFLIRFFLFYAGFHVNIEPRNLFINNNLKPDLLLNNGPPSVTINGRPLALDFSVASIIPGCSKGVIPTLGNGSNVRSMSFAQARNVDKIIKARVTEKINKYSPSTTQAEIEFLPLVFGSSGRMDKKFVDFVGKICKVASEERQIPQEVLRKYWLRTFSFRFQKELATSVIKKSQRMRLGGAENGGVHGNTFTNEYILDCERVVERIVGRD